ncbi:MAG: metallophosphoesterase, partial [Alphaproteobacteria bacterium]
GVHRLTLARSGDLVYSAEYPEIQGLVKNGYTDEGVAFYAAAQNDGCVVSVQRWTKGGLHRFTATASDAAALSSAGWTKGDTDFYLRRAPVDPTFSFAVYSDTQQEVGTDTRFRNRADYLVANRKALDLRYVTHVGDVVNWDTDDHAQYAVARDAMRPLEDAGIPYSLSIGNHDSLATGPGGGARDPRYTRQLVRDTRTFNTYLNRQGLDQEGAYEPGKVDNTFHVFTAGGVGWLVLNLEIWPRPGAVAWAEQVVASHPKHNVIVVTHSYLTGSGGIENSGGYGDMAPSVLASRLVKKYPNVRLVFSGHTGTVAHRTDKGVKGNRIDSFLLNWTSNTTNRTRFVTIDTKKGTLTTWVYAPYTKEQYPQTKITLNKLSWVR